MVTRKRKRRNPARRRSLLFSTRAAAPVRRRRRRRVRRNYWTNDSAGHSKAALKGWRRKRASTRKRKRKNPVYVTPRVRMNRRRRRRTYRRNPGIAAGFRRAFSQQWIMQSLTIAGGIVGGALAMPLVYGVMPEQLKAQRRYLGAVHVLIGSLLIGFMRGKQGRTLGAVIAGTGVYDLIAQNVPQLELPGLPTTVSFIPATMLPAPAPEATSASYMVPRSPVSAPALGTVAASYMRNYGGMAASYEAPGSSTVGLGAENPYAAAGIEW